MRSIYQYTSFLGIAALLLSSCATVFNERAHHIRLHTNIKAKEIVVNDRNIPLDNGSAYFRVERNKEPLIIRLNTMDSLGQVLIKSRNSFYYLSDFVTTFGISALIERKDPKRYYHQKNIYLEQSGDKIKVFRFPPAKKGDIQINLSIPYANLLCTRTATGRIHDPGFIGIGAGIDLFYTNNKYISFYGGAAITNEVPFPVGVDKFGRDETTNNVFVSVRNNHVIGSFDIGYGLSLSWFNWWETGNLNPLDDKERHTKGMGTSLTTHYRITKNFRAGLLYQPSLFRIEHGFHPDYQHLLSAELLFKFKTKKR